LAASITFRINPRRERSRLFREIFKAPFLSGFLRPRLVDSGAIVTFETGHPAMAPQRVKTPRAALASGEMPAEHRPSLSGDKLLDL